MSSSSISKLRRMRLHARLLMACAIAATILVSTWLPLAQAASPLVVTFLDVGPGDAIWVKLPNGQDLLVDGGYPSAGPSVVSYLHDHGCADIEYMLLTHAHGDHVGGLVSVLEAMPVHAVWYNGQPDAPELSWRYELFLDLLADKSIPATVVRAGDTFSIGAVSVQILHPAAIGHDDPNDDSIVCRLSYASVDVLLAGDVAREGEGEMLSRGRALEAEILKVAHHGSYWSSTPGFLAAVSPSIAVVSCDDDGPNSDVLDRLAKVGARVYRTDQDGNVVVTTDGITYLVSTSQPQPAPSPAFLTGRAYREGCTDRAGVEIWVGDRMVLTGSDGAFILPNAPTGAQTVEAVAPGYLRARATSVIVPPGRAISLPSTQLLGGDVNGDGVINIQDLVMMGAAFGQSPPADDRLDLRCDGAINILDLVILARNFGNVGPVHWAR